MATPKSTQTKRTAKATKKEAGAAPGKTKPAKRTIKSTVEMEIVLKERKLDLTVPQKKALKKLKIKQIKISKGHEDEELMRGEMYLGDRRVGHAHEADMGGGVFFHMLSGEDDTIKDYILDNQLMDVFNEYVKDDASESDNIHVSFCEMCAVVIHIANEKRLIERLDRLRKKAILFGTNRLYYRSSWKKKDLIGVRDEYGVESIKEVLDDLITRYYEKGRMFLNTPEQFIELGLGDLLGTHPAYPAKPAE